MTVAYRAAPAESSQFKSPRPKPDDRFIKVTFHQLKIPEPPRGSAPDGEHLTRLEKLVICGILTWNYFKDGKERACEATDLEIAEAIGLRGSAAAKKRQIQIALHGRTIRGVKVPGMADPSRGFVVITPGENESHRRITVSAKFREWEPESLVRIAPEPAEAFPPAEPAVAPELVEPADDASASARPLPPVETPPALDLVNPAPPPAAAVERSRAEILTDAVGPNLVNYPPDELARILIGRLGSRGVRFELQPDGMVKPRLNPGAEPLNEPETAALRLLKPEIVALLTRKQAEAAAGTDAPADDDTAKPAPRVRNAAEVRRMIGRLTAGPPGDDSACQAFADRLVDDPAFACNDQDGATSRETFLGLAREVKHKGLPEAVLVGAFDDACGREVRNRGAYLIASVKRRKSDHLAREDRRRE